MFSYLLNPEVNSRNCQPSITTGPILKNSQSGRDQIVVCGLDEQLLDFRFPFNEEYCNSTSQNLKHCIQNHS